MRLFSQNTFLSMLYSSTGTKVKTKNHHFIFHAYCTQSSCALISVNINRKGNKRDLTSDFYISILRLNESALVYIPAKVATGSIIRERLDEFKKKFQADNYHKSLKAV